MLIWEFLKNSTGTPYSIEVTSTVFFFLGILGAGSRFEVDCEDLGGLSFGACACECSKHCHAS